MSECRTPGMCSPFGGCQDPAQSELAALREELEPKTVKELLEHEHVKALSAKQINDVLSKLHEQNKDLQQRLADAERRNASIVGKVDKCKECGSDALFWFDTNTNTSGIAEGRLRASEVTCTFVLGCADCSATINTVRSDTIAARMTAALTKPEEAKS